MATGEVLAGVGQGTGSLTYVPTTRLLPPSCPQGHTGLAEAEVRVVVTGICASRSLRLGKACVPSRSASRVLAPVTVTVAAWTDEEAWVRASLASWRS